jgi:hypothetical protein
LITPTALLPSFYPDTISERRGSHVSITLFMHILADHRGGFRYSAISESSTGVRCAILKGFFENIVLTSNANVTRKDVR